MKYNFIVLLTDFGDQDNFAGVIEGMIYKTNPAVKVITLTHNIPPQNIFRGAFLLEQSHSFFPDQTIFLNIVDPGVGSSRDIIIQTLGRKVFIAPDNGLLSFIPSAYSVYRRLILPNKYINTSHPFSDTFHGRDIFAPLAGVISNGIDLKKISIKTDKIKRIEKQEIIVKKDKIIGRIIYIDHFGNLTTNISKDIFFDFVNLKNSFKIRIKNTYFRKIHKNYSSEKKHGAVFNSFNLLEFFTPSGSAEESLKIRLGEKVTVIAR
ncbi:MAG: SAM-dependent chlorinase/fluorinase [Spirochaetes bacterium]|nr:SAM-dependent chlorinase/fluorinase [Spirochaetota bacterium]